MMQGWGDALKNLPGIVQGAMQIVDPNLQLQQNLKLAISQHPELAQQLANLESQNPGILAKTFGNSKITSNIANIKPDAQTQIDTATRPEILAAATNPKNAPDIIRRQLGIPTPDDEALKKLQIQQATGDVAAQGQQAQARAQQLQLGTYELANQKIKAQNNARAQQIIATNPALKPEDFFNGSLSLNDQQALFNSDLAPVLQQRLKEHDIASDRAFQIQLRHQYSADNKQAATDQFIRDKTFTTGANMAASIGYAANPASMVALSDPATHTKIEGIVNDIASNKIDPSTLDPQTQDLVRGYQGLAALQNYNSTKRSDAITASQAKIQQQLFGDLKVADKAALNPKESPTNVNALLTRTNQTLATMGKSNHVGYVNTNTGIFGSGIGGTAKNELKVLDSQGKVVDGMTPEDLIGNLFKSSMPVTKPSSSTNVGITTNARPAGSTSNQTNPAITGLVQKYQTLNPAGKAQAKVFAKQNYSPADYQAFISAIGNQ